MDLKILYLHKIWSFFEKYNFLSNFVLILKKKIEHSSKNLNKVFLKKQNFDHLYSTKKKSFAHNFEKGEKKEIFDQKKQLFFHIRKNQKCHLKHSHKKLEMM